MVTSKYRAILYASRSEGSYLPFSDGQDCLAGNAEVLCKSLRATSCIALYILMRFFIPYLHPVFFIVIQ